MNWNTPARSSKRQTIKRGLEAFIRQFGDTAYAPMARQRLEELKKTQVVIAAPLGPDAPSQDGYAMAACRPTCGGRSPISGRH